MLTMAAQLTVVRCRTCRHAYVSTVRDLLRTPEGKRWGWALAWGGRTDGA